MTHGTDVTAPDAAMRAAGPRGDRPRRLILVVSFALHAMLAIVALVLITPPPVNEPQERRMSVEMIDARQFDQAYGPPALSIPAPLAALPPTPPDIISFPADLPPPPHSGERIVAKRFLSAAVLEDPRSADAKAALPMLPSDERLLQLCNIEALEQIAALGVEFDPDLISAYAMDDIRLRGQVADAPGAAIRSRGHWYNLQFECSVTRDLTQVVGFAFQLGDEIPQRQWASHNLAEGEDLD